MARGGGGAARARLWVGLLGIAAGALLVGDPAHRARAAVEWAAAWWPWLLLALASVNLLRAAVPSNSLIGPLLLIAIALTGFVNSAGLDRHLVQNLLLPVALALAGMSLVLSTVRSEPGSRWTRFLTTGEVVVPADAGELLSVRAVLGELRADLRHLGPEPTVSVNVTALAGHVRLAVPQGHEITVHTLGTVLTRVTTPKPGSGDPGQGQLVVHVLGVCGAVSVVRA
ncbi:hypothetical protein ACVNF4_25800 [Streptomyces sp. S6]